MNEVLNERKEIKVKKLDKFIKILVFILYTICLPFCYWIVFFRKDILTDTFVWATGAFTTIWVYRFAEFFPDKEQKEVTND